MFVELSALIPSPLHPAIVHMPIALMVLVPVFAVGALIAIRRGTAPFRSWGITTALMAALTVSAFVAKQTGESQEDTVEQIVGDAPLHQHEEAADTFFVLSIVVLGIGVVGLRSGKLGNAARLTATVGTLGLMVAGYNVGHSGGELVFKHGAASAYTTSSGSRTSSGEDQ